MNDLQTNLQKLEQIAGTYCVGKVEGTVNTPVFGNGDYYAYAKGTSYLASSISDAVNIALGELTKGVA